MTAYRPAISVVIPTYNRAPLLLEALRSLISQTFPNWEAIVVNDSSEDNTVEVVRAFKDQRIRLVDFSSNGIIGACRNKGIRHSQSEIITFLDSDDTWYPKRLERVYEILCKRQEVDLVCHDQWLVDSNGGGRLLKHGPYARYEDLLFKANCVTTSAVIMRGEFLRQAGGFSESVRFVGIEDYDLWLRLARLGCRFEYLHEVLGNYRVHSSNITNKTEVFCEHFLNVLESHFCEWPEKTPHYRNLLRKHRCAVLRGAAQAFIKRGDHGRAKRYISLSLDEDPFSWKAWVLKALNLVRWRKF